MRRSSRGTALRGEVGARLQPQHERRQELRRVLDVDEREHLGGRVHVAERDAHERCSLAAARELDGVCVGTGAPGRTLDLIRDALGLGGLDEQREDLRVDVSAAREARSAAALDLAAVSYT